MAEQSAAVKELAKLCEANLWTFATTVEPHRVYGECHKELYDWWQKCEENGIENTLALMPRDHQKSHCIAVWCCWKITRDPTETIIYLSATSGLAERQLQDIYNILDSTIYRRLWPEMTHPEWGKRAQWNNSALTVDHPLRVAAQLRDPTISIAGLDTVTTGWHCSILIKDDVVVPENAYTRENRAKVAEKASQFASILSPGGLEWVVGTRYHPDDHYNTLIKMQEDVIDDEGNILDSIPVYAVHERVVEVGGIFLWPRMARKSDGKMYGFDMRELNRKKAKYLVKAQFYAQYYNNPNNDEDCTIKRSHFQYYEQDALKYHKGHWYINGRELFLMAAMDFAFSLNKRSDSSCIVVIGTDYERNIYVLDIVRYKTKKTSVYLEKLAEMHSKWNFQWVSCEVTQAQDTIVEYIKDELAKDKNGHAVLKIEDRRPGRNDGSKQERMAAALEPRYENKQVYHYRGGMITVLEEELVMEHPPHDDCKDTLAMAISSGKLRYPHRPQMEDEDDDSQEELARIAKAHTAHGRFGGYI